MRGLILVKVEFADIGVDGLKDCVIGRVFILYGFARGLNFRDG